jgi:hypothetical protein
MKKALSALTFASGLAATTISHAENVKYNFTAAIYRLYEYSAATDTSTTVQSSSFAGALVSNGDVVVGSIIFDNAAPLSPYYQPPIPNQGSYQLYTSTGATQQTAFSVGNNGPTYASSTDASAYTLIQVANNASSLSGWDIFSLSNSAGYNPVMFQNISLDLFDRTATAFNSSAIPSVLNLSNFYYANLNGGWLRQSDGNQFHFDATLTSLVTVPVPEPTTWLLMVFGLTLMLGFKFKSRTRHIRRSGA